MLGRKSIPRSLIRYLSAYILESTWILRKLQRMGYSSLAIKAYTFWEDPSLPNLRNILWKLLEERVIIDDSKNEA